MHNRKHFLRFVGPGDLVEIETNAEELLRFRTGKTISVKPRKVRVEAVYDRRGERPGDHIVKIDSLGILVHSKNLFEVEGWKLRVPGEPEEHEGKVLPFPIKPVKRVEPTIDLLPFETIEELYLAMKHRRDRFLNSRSHPLTKKTELAFQAISRLRDKAKRK